MPVPLPDRATLEAAQKRAEDARVFWSAHRADLTEQYPDEFVAVRNGEVVDHDKDFMALTLRLQKSRVPSSDVSIERMATEPELYLL
jgi:Family of unknown function (DUF5678)